MQQAVPKVRHSDADFSPRRPELSSGRLYASDVVDEVTQEEGFTSFIK
jgi:hypothetical protein